MTLELDQAVFGKVLDNGWVESEFPSLAVFIDAMSPCTVRYIRRAHDPHHLDGSHLRTIDHRRHHHTTTITVPRPPPPTLPPLIPIRTYARCTCGAFMGLKNQNEMASSFRY